MKKLIFFAFIVLLVTPLSVLADSGEDGDAYFNEGVAEYNAGNYQDAGRLFDKAGLAYEKAGTSYRESLMYAYLWSGASSYHVGEIETAIGRYRSSLAVAEERRDGPAMKNILASLGNSYYALEDYQQSEDIYLKILALSRESAPEELNGILQFLGYLNILAGDFEDALLHYSEALEYQPAESFDRSAVHGMLGYAHYSLKNYDVAQEHYQAAVTILDLHGPSTELVQYLGWIGLIHFDRAEYQKAIGYYVKSYVMAREVDDDVEQARMLAQLGFASAALGDYEAGIQYYEKSLNIALDIDDSSFIASAYDSLGDLYDKTSRKTKAHEAYKNLAHVSHAQEQARALNLAGTFSYSLGKFGDAYDEFNAALELFRELELQSDVLAVLYNLGSTAAKLGDDDSAVDILAEAVRLGAQVDDVDESIDAVSAISELYQNSGRREEQIAAYVDLVPMLERRGRDAELATLLNNIGVLYYESSDFQSAIGYYKRALNLSERLGNAGEISAQLHNLSQSLAALGRFDEALTGYQRALSIAEDSDDGASQAHFLNSIGEVHRGWRWYAKSIEFYKASERMYLDLGIRSSLPSVYNNMGMAYRASENEEEALNFFQKALLLFTEFGDLRGQAIALSNIGEIHRDRGEYEEALAKYRAALVIDLEIRNPRGIAIRRNNIGLMSIISGDYTAAEEQLLGVLELMEKIGQPAETARVLNNLGEVYFYKADFSQAASYFSRAIEIKEQLRLTAQGSVRREYLSSEINTYNNLAVTYFHLGELSKSFETIELASAKYLREQMGSKSGLTDIDVKSIDFHKQRLDRKSAVISVTQTDLLYLQVIAFDQNNTYSLLTDDIEGRVEQIYASYGRTMIRRVSDPDTQSIEGVLEFYRYLLAKPLLSRVEREAIRDIGSNLYQMLIEPLNVYLSDIDELIIIPSGQFSFIPFETFILPDGSYLVEKYHIRYTNSMAVSAILNQRKYDDGRLPMLAFGGAVYDEQAYKEDLSRGKTLLADIVARAANAARSAESVRGAFADLGYNAWQNLPGTYAEVKALETAIPDALSFTGALVSEGHVKRLSQQGELKKYRVLHFATHGLTVSEVPELSAVVLSQFAQEQKEDGYLTVREIAEMDIQADFVNLSACETGLGKIYEGEGAVGLTQSFLVAGANGLSVSLWQVADESTTEFMTGMYRASIEQDVPYHRAMTYMKREFIKSETYSHPFYWAPFVYYGE